MNEKEIQEQALIKQFNQQGRNLIESHYSLAKDITLAGASLFGILASLTDSSKDNYWARLFFVLSLCLIALGILATGISMLGKVSYDKQTLSRTLWRINSTKDGKSTGEPPYESGGISFDTTLKVGIILLLASVVSLVMFIIIRNNIF